MAGISRRTGTDLLRCVSATGAGAGGIAGTAVGVGVEAKMGVGVGTEVMVGEAVGLDADGSTSADPGHQTATATAAVRTPEIRTPRTTARLPALCGLE